MNPYFALVVAAYLLLIHETRGIPESRAIFSPKHLFTSNVATYPTIATLDGDVRQSGWRSPSQHYPCNDEAEDDNDQAYRVHDAESRGPLLLQRAKYDVIEDADHDCRGGNRYRNPEPQLTELFGAGLGQA